MYLAPPEALQAFWSALTTLLREDDRMAAAQLPEQLNHAPDCHQQWLAGDLLLSQACGYPLVTQLAGQVQLVGTFAYTVPGVQGIDCRSQLICRTNDPRGTLAAFAGSTLAYNDVFSQSGYNALRAMLATSTGPRPFFARTVRSGAHDRSIEAVLCGQADMAAVDAVSWALWQRSEPTRCARLRVFAQSEAYPGLPLITALGTAPSVLAALRAALQTIASHSTFAEVRAPLLINGFVSTAVSDYQRCLEMQEHAFATGLRTLG